MLFRSHMHIGQVVQTVSKRFKEFKGKNAAANFQSRNDTSTRDMINAMKAMPEYQSMIRQVLVVINLVCGKKCEVERWVR